MNLIGFAGFQEEGEDVYLYQCPVCKTVVYSHDTPCCDECHEVQS